MKNDSRSDLPSYLLLFCSISQVAPAQFVTFFFEHRDRIWKTPSTFGQADFDTLYYQRSLASPL